VEKLAEKIKEAMAGARFAWDAYIEGKETREVKVNSAQIDSVKSAVMAGAAIRVFKNGKMGFAYTTSPDGVKSAVEKAEENCLIEGYENYSPGAASYSGGLRMDSGNFENNTMDKIKEAAFALESSVNTFGSGVKYARDATVSENKSTITYFNSSGSSAVYSRTSAFCYVTAIAGEEGAQEAVDAAATSADFTKLDFAATGKSAAARAAAMLGGGSVKSGKYGLFMPPHTAVDLLSVLSQLFLGNNIRKGKSLFKDNHYGDVIGPDFLEIRDDPNLEMRAGSYPIDAEGTAGLNKAVVKNGKINSFLYDIFNAAGSVSTGNCARRGFKAMAEPGASNFYIPAGKTPREAALENFTGIYADALMGLHTANPVSGNFSLGVAGWLYEKGKIIKPVKETLIAGNIKDIMKNITAICDDLEFYFSFGSPSIVIKDVTAAGKE
jgi:PmbA protein